MNYTLQYIIIGIIILFAIYSLVRLVKRTFTSKKDGKSGCNKGCGCG